MASDAFGIYILTYPGDFHLSDMLVRSIQLVGPGYERLSECTGYSVWRHYYTQQYGVMPLGERLRWSWPDLRKTAKLCIRSLKLLARSVMAKNN